MKEFKEQRSKRERRNGRRITKMRETFGLSRF